MNRPVKIPMTENDSSLHIFFCDAIARLVPRTSHCWGF